MEVKATLKYARISPQKCRLVADQIRGQRVDEALNVLVYSQKKSATMIQKILESAIANAENNDGLDVDDLYVSTAYVDEGPMLKRIRARAKGRAARIIKRTSHITIAVAEQTR